MIRSYLLFSLSLLCCIFTCPLTALDQPPQSPTQEQVVPENQFPMTNQPEVPMPTAPSFQALFAKTMVLVIFLLALATGALILLKKTQNRFFKAQNQGTIAILEKRALSPKTQLFLVSVNGKEILLVESAHTITLFPTPSLTPPKEIT